MSTEQNTEHSLEYEKLELEREKVRLERFKVWWTGISIMVPLLVAAVSISFGMWTQSQQAKLQSEIQAQQAKVQLELQDRQARSQFELKAAEIVMNTETPLGALTKARALANMFPERLPKNFAETFDPARYNMRTRGRVDYSKWLHEEMPLEPSVDMKH
jgi:hypothetical protein